MRAGRVPTRPVTVAPFGLRFRGRDAREGRRPLLVFGFDQLELSLAGRRLLQRNLPAADPRRRPFFALIHRHEDGWLAARGRGGGLALWRLAGDPGLRR